MFTAAAHGLRKSRMFKRAPMLLLENSSPRGLSASACRSMTSAASGMSLVMTRSPGSVRRTISLSATSNPPGSIDECTSVLMAVCRGGWPLESMGFVSAQRLGTEFL